MKPHDSELRERGIPFDLLERPRVSRWAIWGRWLRTYGARVSCSLGCLGVLILIFFPVVHHPSNRERSEIYCLSNVKQVELGVLMYQQDWDERYMGKVGWVDAAMPYVKNEGVFRCPEVKAGYGYAFNGVLSRRRTKFVPVPELTPVVYDSESLFRGAFDEVSSLPRPGRHHRGNNVGYADGHAKWRRDSDRVEAFPRNGGRPAERER